MLLLNSILNWLGSNVMKVNDTRNSGKVKEIKYLCNIFIFNLHNISMTHRIGNQFVFSGKRVCRKSVGGEREGDGDGDGGIPVSVTIYITNVGSVNFEVVRPGMTDLTFRRTN